MESDRKGGFIQPQCLTCLPPPPSSTLLLTSQSDQREELCSERSHLTSTVPPHPVRYVTGPSAAIPNCCHHLFISPFPSRLPPHICLQPRMVQVSLMSDFQPG